MTAFDDAVVHEAVDPGLVWSDLVAAALIGTDRREPPAPAVGALATLALEAPPADAAAALAQQVAALTVLGRASASPPRPPALLIPVDDDPRPMCSPAAAHLAHRIVAEWPMLEREWLESASLGGWRLSPDLVPVLLRRHRSNPQMRALVCELSGPLADWLTDHLPALAPATRRTTTARVPIALPPELAAAAIADVEAMLAVLTDGLRRQRYSMASRAVVVELVVRMPIDHLPQLAEGLDALDPHLPGRGLVHHLLDLVETRLAIARELSPDTQLLQPEETP
jgi:hypothetical protein